MAKYENYDSLKAKLKDNLILSGVNSEGENVILSVAGEDCVCLITAQHNNWVRKNYYYADGTVEELYEH